MERFLGEPSLLGEGLDRGDSIPNPALSEGRGGSGPNRASPGVTGRLGGGAVDSTVDGISRKKGYM